MSAETREEWQDDEINLLDCWRVLKRRGWMILGLTIASVFTAGFYSYFISLKFTNPPLPFLRPDSLAGEGRDWRLRSRHPGRGSFLGV